MDMGEDKENSGSSLGDVWAQHGLTSKIESDLDKAEGALSRNSQDNAATHLSHALNGLEQLQNTLTSERLSDTENDKWKTLRVKDRSDMDDAEKTRLKFLNDKALGLIKEPTIKLDPNLKLYPKDRG